MPKIKTKIANIPIIVIWGLSIWGVFALGGCSDSGSGSGGTVALEGLSYESTAVVYGAGTEIEANVATLDKGSARFSVSPDLPEGLVLDENTGVISGTPALTTTGTPTTPFIITASNNVNSLTITVEITVLGLQKFCVPDIANNEVVIIDTTRLDSQVRIAVTAPTEVAFGNNRFAIASTSNLIIIDAETNEQIASIDVGATINSVVFGANRFAVAADNELVIINANTNTEVGRATLGATILDVVFGNDRFAAAAGTDGTSIVDTNAGILNNIVFAGSDVNKVAFGNNRFAVIDTGNVDVCLINATTNNDIGFIDFDDIEDDLRDIAFGNNRFGVLRVNQTNGDLVTIIANDVQGGDITVGANPVKIIFGNGRFAVANQVDNTVSIIDGSNEVVLQTVAVSFGPNDIVFGSNRFYVAHNFIAEATIIDAVDDTVEVTISDILGANAFGAFSLVPGEQTFCVANFGQAVLIDANLNSAIAFVDFTRGNKNARLFFNKYSRSNRGVAFIPVAFGNNSFGCVDANNNEINVIDATTAEVLDTQNTADGNPASIAFGNNRFAVGDIDDPAVTILDVINSTITTLAINDVPLEVAFGNNRFAVGTGTGVSLIDAENDNVVTELTGFIGFTVFFANNLFISVDDIDEATIIQNDSIVDTVKVGQNPIDVAFGNDLFFIANRGDTVTLLDSNNSVINTISVLGEPQDLVFGNNRFAIVSAAANSTTVIDANRQEILATLAVGQNPLAISFGNNRFITANSDDQTVTIIDAITNEVTTTIDVGFDGFGLAFNPGN